jgi:hypothetical protein
MRNRHPNHRLVKIHRNYTVEEIADLFGIHKNTVRGWVKVGLATTDKKRPMLFLGDDLVAFLQLRRKRNKKVCRPGELYCVRCREPKPAGGDMAEYTRVTETTGNLMAICPDCDAIMNRLVSLARIGEVCGRMEISFPEALRHIVESDKPTVNSDFE